MLGGSYTAAYNAPDDDWNYSLFSPPSSTSGCAGAVTGLLVGSCCSLIIYLYP